MARGGFTDISTLLNVYHARDYNGVATAVQQAAVDPSGSATVLLTDVRALAADLTIPANVALRVIPGGLLTGPGALTVLGAFDAGPYPVFAGPVPTLSADAVAAGVRPEWFGTVGDGVTDDTAALNRMAAACPANAEIVVSKLHKVAGTFNLPTASGVVVRAVSPEAGFDCGSTGQVNGNGTSLLSFHAKLTGTSTGYLFSAQAVSGLRLSGFDRVGGQRQLYLNGCSDFMIESTRHASTNTAGAAQTNECITCYQCDHFLIVAPRVTPYVAPAGANNFSVIDLIQCSYFEVAQPIIKGVDLSQLPSGAGVSCNGCDHFAPTGGVVAANKGCDGVLIGPNAGIRSADFTVGGLVSVGNNPSAGAGSHAETGDGLDIFQSDRGVVTGCNLTGNGVVGPHYNLEIFSCTEISVVNTDASSGGFGGVTVDASTGVHLVRVRSVLNQGSGCYQQGASSAWYTDCDFSNNNNGAGNPGPQQDGLYVSDSGTFVVVGGCFRDTRGAGHLQTVGIQAENTAPGTVTGADVTGNVVRGVQDSVGKSVWRDCPGWNPYGPYPAQPAVPASGTAYSNTTHVGGVVDSTVFVSGGTVSAVAVGGTSTGLVSGAFRVPAGQSITLTYTVAPNRVWFGD